MNEFGWNYPAGAANDPRAPYNEVDPQVVKSDAVVVQSIHFDTEVESDDWDWYDGVATYTGDIKRDAYTLEGMLQDLAIYIRKDIQLKELQQKAAETPSYKIKLQNEIAELKNKLATIETAEVETEDVDVEKYIYSDSEPDYDQD